MAIDSTKLTVDLRIIKQQYMQRSDKAKTTFNDEIST